MNKTDIEHAIAMVQDAKAEGKEDEAIELRNALRAAFISAISNDSYENIEAVKEAADMLQEFETSEIEEVKEEDTDS